MKIVYVAHPVGAATAEGVQANLVKARRWLQWIMRNFAVAVVADWVLYCELLDDMNPADRAFGLVCDDALVSACEEIWLVGGRVSSGMAREKGVAEGLGLLIRDLTELGEEPPLEVPDGFLEDVPRRVT